jgi:hypothetical protein
LKLEKTLGFRNLQEKLEIIFFQSGKLFFPIFPSATLQRNNEIPNQSNLLGLRKDRKYLVRKKKNLSLNTKKNLVEVCAGLKG